MHALPIHGGAVRGRRGGRLRRGSDHGRAAVYGGMHARRCGAAAAAGHARRGRRCDGHVRATCDAPGKHPAGNIPLIVVDAFLTRVARWLFL